MKNAAVRLLAGLECTVGDELRVCYCFDGSWLLDVPATGKVYLMGRSAETVGRAATLRLKVADQTCYLAHLQYTDTGQISPCALLRQAPGRVAMGVSNLKSLT